MSLALFIGTDVAILTAFMAATAALGFIIGRALKRRRDAEGPRRLHQAP